MIVRSSHADLYIDPLSGAIQKIDYAAMGGKDAWDDVERFDPMTLGGDEIDCLLTGFWTKDGKYVPPIPEDELVQ